MKLLSQSLILFALVIPALLCAQSTDHVPTPAALAEPGDFAFSAGDTEHFPGDQIITELAVAYPKLKVTWQAPTVYEFLPKLAAANQTGGHVPDILFVSTVPLKRALASQNARLVVGRPTVPGGGRGAWYIPNAAPDPKRSEAFALWLDRRIPHPDSELLTPESKAQIGDAALLAARAVGSTLKAPPDAVVDPAIASFAWDWTSTRLAGAAEQQVFTPEVSGIAGNERLAFAYVTALAQGDDFFGLRHFFVILRKTENAWLVLYLQSETDARAVMDVAGIALELKNGLQPFTTFLMPLSPLEGSRVSRRPTPEVSFDQEGEPGFIYGLETQSFDSFHSKWSPTDLTFSAGLDPKAHLMKMTANFAPRASNRWRIWSISKAGTVTLSGWQTIETTY